MNFNFRGGTSHFGVAMGVALMHKQSSKTEFTMIFIRSFSFILMLIIFSSCFQKQLKIQQNPSHVLDSLYTWDVELSDRGSQMFLDIPYQPCNTCETEYLTLSVSKDKLVDRPYWIAIILPCKDDQVNPNLAHPKGVSFFFLKETLTDSLDWATDLMENDVLRFYFGKCEGETYSVRMINGYTVDTIRKKTVDVFRKFQQFNWVYFFIFYSDGSEKLVKVPLKSFQNQYLTLE